MGKKLLYLKVMALLNFMIFILELVLKLLTLIILKLIFAAIPVELNKKY